MDTGIIYLFIYVFVYFPFGLGGGGWVDQNCCYCSLFYNLRKNIQVKSQEVSTLPLGSKYNKVSYRYKLKLFISSLVCLSKNVLFNQSVENKFSKKKDKKINSLFYIN